MYPTDLKYFKREEFQINPEDNPDNIDHDFLYRLDSLRGYTGMKIIVTSSTSGTHIKDSYHYKGLACDVIFPEWKGSLFGLYLIIERFNFTGIGMYPDWHYQQKKIGGFHLDRRPVKNYQGARWIGYNEYNMDTNKNEQKYIALNIMNMKRLKLLI